MRLCLDEHYSPEIARQLSERGHEVSSVQDRSDLRGLPDSDLLAALIAESSALLTENVADFVVVSRELADQGEQHWGIVFTSPRSMPRGSRTIGLYVEALDAFLAERPEDGALMNQISWLQPPDQEL